MSNEPRVFIIDPDEIDRYARAIARIEFARHAPNVGTDPSGGREFSSGDMAATR